MSHLQSLLPLGMVLLLRAFDLQEHIQILRVAYGVTQLTSILLWIFVYLKVQRLPKGGNKIVIPEQKQMGQVVKPATERTVKEHDMEKWMEEFQKLAIGLVIVVGFHMYWGAIVPLAIQSVMAPFGIFSNKLFSVHVLDKDIVRPFPISLPFGSDGSSALERTSGSSTVEVAKPDEKKIEELSDSDDKPAEKGDADENPAEKCDAVGEPDVEPQAEPQAEVKAENEKKDD
eukprot:GEMP01042243.1.p1 GENE.GEMP01042243.1~~GEMP01042243.1.p1  ORF type:complete len:242 (+),score=59.08 GEMP01042243.1:38-727(+)